jgi:transcriptional regulator with XRE-family HTH domain
MTPEQCRMARAALKWSTKQLAERADVGLNTVNRFEEGGNTQTESVDRMRQALENNGIRFQGSIRGSLGVELSQRIWRLTPIDPSNENWEASTWRGSVVVRAPTERIARWRAKIAFVIATRRRPGQTILMCPWGFANFVRAEEVQDSSYQIDGPTAILDPATADREVPSGWDRHRFAGL